MVSQLILNFTSSVNKDAIHLVISAQAASWSFGPSSIKINLVFNFTSVISPTFLASF